ARAFFDLYFVGDDAEISAKGGAGSNAGSDAESVRANAEKKLALVERTGDPDFPYFFPNIKDTAVYFIEKQ
ncbi:MAG: hypothetical protein LBS85_07360, partial [Clostridiales Family XIII bacterium]|nr:hypothetical protein [Clostridiales Family XIII bacterium]